MNPRTAAGLSARIDAIYRTESRRILATLIRLLGDFDQAEEAMHEAFAAAVEQWASDGIPDNPRAWLVSTGRFKFIDKLRRRTRFDTLTPELVRLQDDARGNDPAASELDGLEDDRLRLIFTCCHPALSTDAQVALTLREICDLTTEEIARSYLAAPSTLAQRIVRAKAKIKRARIPYEVPSPAELPDRLEAVLRVVYLVFNEGYAASSGDTLTRQDLSGEAIRLGRLLAELLPDPDVLGLLALMLFHEARRAARTDDTGELVRLEDQDRKLWDNATIAEANTLLDRAFAGQRIGAYTLQAAIIGVHANTATAADTDWNQIIALYDLLHRLHQVMDSTEPFEIISGYRSSKTNKMLANKSRGVAKKSLHMRAMAADISLPGRDLENLYWAARTLKRGGTGFYAKSGFIHVDCGRVRFW